MPNAMRRLFHLMLCGHLVAASLLWAQGGLQLTVLTGDGVTNYADTGEAVAPVVQVLDAQGNPLPEAEVSFTSPLTGPSVTFYGAINTTSLTTDLEGRAQAPNAIANTYEGPFTIDIAATYQGQSATAQITQTNALAEYPQEEKKFFGWGVITGIAFAATLGIIAITRTGGDN